MIIGVVKVLFMSNLTHSLVQSFMLVTKGVVAEQTHL